MFKAGLVAAVLICLAGCGQSASSKSDAKSGSTDVAPTTSSSASPDPLVFLTELYSHYRGAQTPDFVLFDHAQSYFDPSLVTLINEDEQLAARNGDEGLDSDPVCACQDPGAMGSPSFRVTENSGTHATAIVSIPYTDADHTDLTMSLVLTDGAWRIHDISGKDAPSLRAALSSDAAAERASAHR
jgi:hypothetical protein